MSTAPALNQSNFWIRLDGGGVDATPTWAAAANTNYTTAAETLFRIRFVVDNSTGTGAGAGPYILRVSKNSGAYTAVTTTSGATLGAQSADASTSTDETAITVARILGSLSTNGVYDETGSATKSVAAGGFTEFEYGLILKTAGTANGDTFDFRIYNSTTVFTTYTRTPRLTATVVDTVDDLLANNVISTSSVSPAPQLRQEQAVLANDVVSTSSVSIPALVQRRDLLANDVLSASSVSVPAVVVTAAPTALLANDVLSASSVSQPAATILRGLLANDVKSNSSVSQPAVKALHGLLANDVKSNSSVGQPAAVIGRPLLANDVVSGSSVSQPAIVVTAGQNALQANDVLSASTVGNPALHTLHGLSANDVVSASSVSQPALVHVVGSTALLANDVLSTSSVSQPAALIRWNILANDIASTSSVGQPALHTLQGLNANDVVSASSVSVPLFGEIAAGSLLSENVTSASTVGQPALYLVQDLLAQDVISGSSVSQPMLDRPEVVVPPLPMGGASAGGYGYYRRRRPEDEEEYQREREKREERIRDLARVIDRAIAKAQSEIAPLTEAPQPPLATVSQPEAIAIDDALETIQDRVQAIEDLGSRILEADAELEALRQEAIALMIEAELDDDDEALELLLAA